MLLDVFCHKNCKQWLADLMPAYNSMLLVGNSTENISPLKEAVNYFFQGETIEDWHNAAREIIIPVCYDQTLGNDLERMAAFHQVAVETIVAVHHQVTYHVYMLGFLPGFAYMGEVNEQIATPRKAVPVPTRAGAVGIAGIQTGIYPLDSPGGWNIVGYTPLKMFDISMPSPTFLAPGNAVKFMAIDLITYNSMLKDDGSY
jgi:KipI family sensor histidine kinase inhibitor